MSNWRVSEKIEGIAKGACDGKEKFKWIQICTDLFKTNQEPRTKKDYRTNHGEEFTGGMEDKYGDKFKTYMGCCTTVLMDERLKSSVKRGYYG